MVSEARRYQIQEVLGRGSFGVVYRAHLLSEGGFTKPVALKVLKTEAFPSAEIERRLRDEARMLGMIRHPAVVQVDALARLGSGWAVVMEYVPGVDLGELARGEIVPPRVALEIGEQVAGALHAAWSMPSEITGRPLRLIHRDLKPSNVRITGHGEVKVLDFGAARADFGGRESSTQAWRFGTPRYMSPERHDGVEGPEGDVYALGLVLAALLGGGRVGDPPTNAARHAGFVSALMLGVESRLADHLPDRLQRQAILSLLSDLLAYEPGKRIDARQAQQRLRALSDAMSGPGLRTWAEDVVPVVMLRLPPLTNDARCGETVVEGGPMPEAAETAPTPADGTLQVLIDEPTTAVVVPWRRALVGVGLGLFAVGTLWFFVGRDQGAEVAAPTEPPASPVLTEPHLSPSRFELVPDEAGPSISEAPEVVPEPSVSTQPATDVAPKKPASTIASSPRPPKEAEPQVVVPVPAAPPELAHVESSPGAASFQLSVGAQRYPAGDVPAGSYTILLAHEGEDVPAGTLNLRAGERARLKCSESLLVCRKESM